ncbi:hypothetical protein [Marispirochaeta sp.]|jgi:hypothetical protein|uniref:hypothetical protein n=1 Tax=Marispirochaeta sp. TaxID=2038653 RepID=UPI0029C617EE|nr:hypothetical protein [Marispirochaeta sp.]
MSSRSNQNLHEVEKDFFSKFRNRVTNSEKLDDLRRCFTTSVAELLGTLLEEDISLNGDDVSFRPEEKDHYWVNDEIRSTPRFAEVLQNPEVRQIVKKAAQTAYHRYLHLKKHPEKTELKIRN